MKVLVIYYSESGNTERIANAIHDEIDDEHQKSIFSMDNFDINQVSAYDLIFVGSPCHSSNLARPVKKLLAKLPKKSNLKLAGFMTHSVPEEDDSSEEIFNTWMGKSKKSFTAICKKKDIEFLGFFNCQGVATPDIKKFIHRKIYQDDIEFKRYIEQAESHPDSQDIQKARLFAKRMVSVKTQQ